MAEETKPAKPPRDYELHKNITAAIEHRGTVTIEHADGRSVGTDMPIVNYEVQNEEIRTTMTVISERIHRALPNKWGFAVFIFDEGQEGDPTKSAAVPGQDSAVFYASSHNRGGVVTMLKAWLDRQAKS